MLVALSLCDLDPCQISRQHNTEESEQHRYKVDNRARGFERVGVDLNASLSVAIEPGNNQQHAGNDRDHAQPRGQSRSGGWFLFELHEFLEGNREAADSKSEDDSSDAGPNPREKRALIRQMVAGVGIVGHAGTGGYYSTAF